MEFILFGLSSFSAFLLCIKNSKKIHNYLFIPFYILFVIVSRNTGFDTDIKVYAEYMRFYGISPYFLREIAFYYTMSFLYSIIKNQVYVFIIVDILLMIIAFISCRNIFGKDYNKYVAHSMLLCSFMALMGQQNIYRQYFAMTFLLFAVSLVYKYRRKTGTFFYLISVFCHNSVAIFTPGFSYFFMKKNKAYLPLFVLLGMTAFFVIFGSGRKSNRDTGMDLSLFYIFLGFIIYFISLFNNEYKMEKSVINSGAIIWGVFTCIILYLFFESSAVERVMMIYYYTAIPFLIKGIAKTNIYNKISYRIIFFGIFVVPGFIFPSSRAFIS